MLSFVELKLTCSGCGACLVNELLFGLHLSTNKSCAAAEASATLEREKSKKHRIRRTIDFKCQILSDLVKLERRGIPHAQTVLLKFHTGVSSSDVSRWQLARTTLFHAQRAGHGQKRYMLGKTRVWYSREEDEVYVRFIYRREVQGLKTGDNDLVLMMHDTLVEFQPPGWKNFKCSPGWLSKFKKRYKISSQQRNNKKHLPIHERAPALRSFHMWLLHTLQRSAPQTCPRYVLY